MAAKPGRVCEGNKLKSEGLIVELKKAFHKIKIGFDRMWEEPIPWVSDEKKYGNDGEKYVFGEMKKRLPNCQIKQNIIIQTPEGNAEIDCIVLYKNKLFAIEIKHWKGTIVKEGEEFYQEKTDKWTGEVYTTNNKSPIKQLSRAIFLLRKHIFEKKNINGVWINPIVFFADADEVFIDDFYAEYNDENYTKYDDILFSRMEEMISYMEMHGEISNPEDAVKGFNVCKAADCILKKDGREMQCIVEDNSLNFLTLRGAIKRKDVLEIRIEHHWHYDTLYIKTKDGSNIKFPNIENAKIYVTDNGVRKTYALCKIDYIKLG